MEQNNEMKNEDVTQTQQVTESVDDGYLDESEFTPEQGPVQKSENEDDDEKKILVDSPRAKTIKDPTKEVAARKPHYVTSTGYISEKKVDDGQAINLPPDTFENIEAAISERGQLNALSKDEKSADWINAVDGSKPLQYDKSVNFTQLEDPNSDFRQDVSWNGSTYAGRSIKFKQKEDKIITGELAVIRLLSHLGSGTIYQQPLWHSGIWVSFKPPMTSDIVELTRLISSEEIEWRKNTGGMIFSGINTYITSRIIDFVIAHIYNTSIKKEELPGGNYDGLKDIILCQDIPALIHGLACTIYPNGFKFRRGCTSMNSECKYVLEDTLNLKKIMYVNNSMLTQHQKVFMSSRENNIRTLDEIKRYQEELLCTQKRTIPIKQGDKNFEILLKSPTIRKYLETGVRWIEEKISVVEDAIQNTSVSNQLRDNYVYNQLRASALRNYSQWIDRFIFDSYETEDATTIEASLEQLSSDKFLRNAILKGVKEYINGSSMTVIGIPVFECPECGKKQDLGSEYALHPNIIPLDTVMLFFVLLTQRYVDLEIL